MKLNEGLRFSTFKRMHRSIGPQVRTVCRYVCGLKWLLYRCCFPLLVLCSFIQLPVSAQTPPPPPTTASTVLSQMATVFSSGQVIHSIQLSGNATFYAGSLHDSGTATLIASADGSSQLKLALASGTRTETQTPADTTRSCQWSGVDGVAHDGSNASCWNPVVWYLPQITLQPSAFSPFLGTNYEGLQSTTTFGPCQVIMSQVIPTSSVAKGPAATQIQNFSSATLFIDATGFYPRGLLYELLSDSGSRRIAVEARYTNYRSISGVLVPTHIERYLNGSLQLAMDITQVSILN